MAISVNTNVGALSALASASANNKSLETSMGRLASGKRINSASDDAAGMAIAARLTSEIRGTNMAIRNASDGQALLDTAEGASNEVVNILQRMRELANQAANDTNNTQDRTNITGEMSQLKTEIDRIANTTSWAGIKLLDGSVPSSGLNIQVGSNTSTHDKITVAISSITSASLGINGAAAATAATGVAGVNDTATTLSQVVHTVAGTLSVAANLAAGNLSVSFDDVDGNATAVTVVLTAGQAGTSNQTRDAVAVLLAQKINDANVGFTAKAAGDLSGSINITKGSMDVTTNSAARSTVTAIDAALNTVNTQRAALGATSNRLDSTINNLTNIATNLETGRGRVEDADFAGESTNMARAQILQQAATAMLAQANASKQGVLQLLQR